jgi:hypothetical protein
LVAGEVTSCVGGLHDHLFPGHGTAGEG